MTQPTVTDDDRDAAEQFFTPDEFGYESLCTVLAAHRLLGQRQGIEMAANVCGTLAETTYDDTDGFEAATGCEAAIRNLAPEAVGQLIPADSKP